MRESITLITRAIRKQMKPVIKSISYSNTEILNAINKLYLDNKGFDLDPTYSKGNFYKDFPEPKKKSDLIPRFKDVRKSDFTDLFFPDESLQSIIFDPPFLFRGRKSINNSKTEKTTSFSYYKTFGDLLISYSRALKEFYRILKPKGILAFKCQDMSDNKFYPNHIEVFNLANPYFKILDLFILLSKSRVFHAEQKQRVARKFHSYWYVFKKV